MLSQPRAAGRTAETYKPITARLSVDKVRNTLSSMYKKRIDVEGKRRGKQEKNLFCTMEDLKLGRDGYSGSWGDYDWGLQNNIGDALKQEGVGLHYDY